MPSPYPLSGGNSNASSVPARRQVKKYSSVSNLSSHAQQAATPNSGSSHLRSNSAVLSQPPTSYTTQRPAQKVPGSVRGPPPSQSSLYASNASLVASRSRNTLNRSKSSSDLAGREVIPNSPSRSRRGEHVTIEGLLKKGPGSNVSASAIKEALQELRYLVLTEGIPSNKDGNSPIRGYVWSVLLQVPPMKTNDYLALVRRGASLSYSKIRNDTFRTLTTDVLFQRNVTEASLIRLLNAYAWTLYDKGERDGKTMYVQGMNVMAAPFLYACRSEVQAYSLFSRFVTKECPGYVRPTMEGVHKGLKLVDEVLATVDPKLFGHLKSKNLKAELYAFASVLTLSACTPPLNEVLLLWDFLIAYGAHLNILCVVAQLLLMRDKLLAAPQPMKLLRQFPALRSREIISVAVSLVRRVPGELYERLVVHAK